MLHSLWHRKLSQTLSTLDPKVCSTIPGDLVCVGVHHDDQHATVIQLG